MKKTPLQHSFLRLVFFFSLSQAAVLHAAGAPVLFFSDLTSGPNTGGENNNGAYVTLYGNNLGTNPTITVGGGQATVKLAPSAHMWYQKMTIQLGASAATGNIVLTNGQASNTLPFTVRSGNIFFVSTSGSDSSAGSFAAPFKTIPHARDIMQAGDITYAMNGVTQTADDLTDLDGNDYVTSLVIQKPGTAANPYALVAYPGATVIIGSTSGGYSGIRGVDRTQYAPGHSGPYWVFAGLTLRGQDEALTTYGGTGWRIVGNDMTCPNGDGATACLEASVSSFVYTFGNNVHDAGKSGASAEYHGVYYSTDSNDIFVGWNTISNVLGCRGLQIHSSPIGTGTGMNQYDLHIHDNVIHDTQCDGIVLATVDPSKGPVEVFNNVIYNAGKGNTPEGSGAWNCVYVADGTNVGPAGTGTVEIYNNTMYNCGPNTLPPYNGSSASVLAVGDPNFKIRLRNNIMVQNDTYQPFGGPAIAVPYIVISGPGAPSSGCTDANNCNWVSGSNNLFFGTVGNGAPPTNNGTITGSLNVDPKFTNAAQANFALLSGSPAFGAGTNTGVCPDASSGWDIGACNASSAGSSAPPPPPPPPPASSGCDLNSDGQTNVVDVQLMVNQALGVTTCTGDINKDGVCNVVDVQRDVNAALGGQCVTN